MKNLMKLLPLVALTLLVSCGGGSKITKEEADCLVNNGGASCVEMPTPEPTPEPTALDEIDSVEEITIWNKVLFAGSKQGEFYSNQFTTSSNEEKRLELKLNEDGSGRITRIVLTNPSNIITDLDRAVEWDILENTEGTFLRVKVPNYAGTLQGYLQEL